MHVRSRLLTVRVTEQEEAIFDMLAAKEKLQVGTLMRRLVLLEAEKQGIVMPIEETNRDAGLVLADTGVSH